MTHSRARELGGSQPLFFYSDFRRAVLAASDTHAAACAAARARWFSAAEALHDTYKKTMCEYTQGWRARYVADDADALREQFDDSMREFAWAYQRHLDVLRRDLVRALDDAWNARREELNRLEKGRAAAMLAGTFRLFDPPPSSTPPTSALTLLREHKKSLACAIS